jgi:3-isopropylmalate/(R)-2-methylmalate dehydratase small subunit
LNDPTYKGEILVAGKNFGSGSSREHAAWSIYDYGFRCVISSFFADIFKNNCLNIGVLPVKVEPAILKTLFEIIYENPNTEIMVDLPSQLVSVKENNLVSNFEISSYKKNNLLNGFDDIDYLLNIKNEINDFAKKTLF